MNTKLTTLSAAFDSACSTLAAMMTELHALANTQRKELLAILAGMQETQNTLDAVCGICSETADILTGIAEDGDELIAKMGDAMEDPADACPHCNFEDLLGFCDHCGAEITETNLGSFEDDEMFCDVCDPQEEEDEEEDEDEEVLPEAPEQLVMDLPLAESVN